VVVVVDVVVVVVVATRGSNEVCCQGDSSDSDIACGQLQPMVPATHPLRQRDVYGRAVA
jgi:hypothetical protein